jgi:hypothetical protein
MEKFKTDLSEIDKIINPDLNKIPLKGNEHRIVRVAFDLFRIKNNDPEELWQVQSNDDGEFLVRTYTLPEEEKVITSDWSIKEDNKKANLTIAYKDIPIKRIVVAKYGAETEEDVLALQKAIFRKLSTDSFIAKMLDTLPEIKRNILKEAGLKISKVNPILAALEINLQKKAEGDESAMSDEEFEEAWWDSGMETYGPAPSEGFEADKASLLDDAEHVLNNYKIDDNIKRKIKSLMNKISSESVYDTKNQDILEKILERIEEERDSKKKFDLRNKGELEDIFREMEQDANESAESENRKKIEQDIKNMSDESFQKLEIALEKLNII